MVLLRRVEKEGAAGEAGGGRKGRSGLLRFPTCQLPNLGQSIDASTGCSVRPEEGAKFVPSSAGPEPSLGAHETAPVHVV